MKSQKITKWYDDACGAAHGLELLGERWALLVVRELMFGPRRFGALRGDLHGISANVLTQRLAGLEAAGIVRRRQLPPPASAQVYELTPWGTEAGPIFQALGRWAARSPGHDPRLPFSAASMLLSFTTLFDAARAGDLAATIGFAIGADRYRVRIAAGALAAERGAIDTADAALTGDPATIASVVYGGRPLADAEAAGALALAGDRALAERFVTLFPLPAKAAPEKAG